VILLADHSRTIGHHGSWVVRYLCRYRSDLVVVSLFGLFVGHLVFHSKIFFNRPQKGTNGHSSTDLEYGYSGSKDEALLQGSGYEDADPCCAQLEDEVGTPKIKAVTEV